MTYKDYALIPLDRNSYFNFEHSTWDHIRGFALANGRISLRTIYSTTEADYYKQIQDLSPNADWDKMRDFIKNQACIIFEASQNDKIIAISVGSFFNSDPMLLMYIESEEARELRAVYAMLYEAIQFAKNNLKAPYLKIRYRVADAEVIDSFHRV